MKRIIFAALAAFSIATFAAPIPQASQAWVEMKLNQLRQNLIQTLGNQYTSASDTGDTNAPSATVAANAANRAIADAMPLADMLATPVEITVTSNSVPCFFCGGSSNSLTNYLDYGLFIPMVSAGTYSTNGITIVTSGATNTLTVSSYTLRAETNDFYFVSADSSDFAYLYMTFREGGNE